MSDNRGKAGQFLPSGEYLRAATDDQLAALYDEAVDSANGRRGVVGSVNSDLAYAKFVHEEIDRRRTLRLTRTIKRLTWAVTVLTVANVGFVVYTIFS